MILDWFLTINHEWDWFCFLESIGISLKESWIGYETLHGGLSNVQRTKNLGKFRGESTCKVLLATVKAGGVGIDLRCAQNVYIMVSSHHLIVLTKVSFWLKWDPLCRSQDGTQQTETKQLTGFTVLDRSMRSMCISTESMDQLKRIYQMFKGKSQSWWCEFHLYHIYI